MILTPACGALFAVDSWFLDNGVESFILPLEMWAQGWKPPEP